MLIKKHPGWFLSEQQATPESIYRQRRDLVKKLAIATAVSPLAATSHAGLFDVFNSKEKHPQPTDPRHPLPHQSSPLSDHNLALTPEDKVLTYNNFYEFGANKGQPAELSQGFNTLEKACYCYRLGYVI